MLKIHKLTYTGHNRSYYFNRFPRANLLCNKREFHILLNTYNHLFPGHFDFLPTTYILPEQYIQFTKCFVENEDNKILLAKPSKGRCGQGIFLLKDASDLSEEVMQEYLYIAQDYIPNPMLIDNKKFDFRLYLMINKVDEMEAYIAFEGL